MYEVHIPAWGAESEFGLFSTLDEAEQHVASYLARGGGSAVIIVQVYQTLFKFLAWSLHIEISRKVVEAKKSDSLFDN